MPINLFSAKGCPGCHALKVFLRSKGKHFFQIDASTPGGLTELRLVSPGAMQLPVLEVEGDVYQAEEIWDGTRLLPGKWLIKIGLSGVE